MVRVEIKMDYRQIITMEPGKMGGKPCVRSLEITVNDVLDYLASRMTEAEILADFPGLAAPMGTPAWRLPLTMSAAFFVTGRKSLASLS